MFNFNRNEKLILGTAIVLLMFSLCYNGFSEWLENSKEVIEITLAPATHDYAIIETGGVEGASVSGQPCLVPVAPKAHAGKPGNIKSLTQYSVVKTITPLAGVSVVENGVAEIPVEPRTTEIMISEFDAPHVQLAKSLGYDYVKMTETTLADVYTAEEIEYLYRMVETENYQASFISKVHCAEVVFARIRDERFPDTIKSVITSPSQFVYGRTTISEDTKLACEYAWQYATETENALFFRLGESSSWYGEPFLIKDAEGQVYYGPECEDAPVIAD